jgi:predicted Fe-Mo cluster-binding NifX family protein
MKIALPTRQNQIDSHFGHCEYFTVLTVDDISKEIISQDTVKSPEGCGCKSDIASVLSGMGVTVMLAGDMGEGAVHVLNSSGIQVLRGCSGNIIDVAVKWLCGVLEDSGESCHAHDHECHQ